MSETNGSINYAAVLADLERKRTELDSAIAAIRAILGTAPVSPPAGMDSGSGNTPGSGSSVQVRSDAFVGMSIVDASKKYLGMVKAPQSTAILVEILGKGGVPKPIYNTVFAVLARQERMYGDVVKLPSKEWALAEWYPGTVKRRKKTTDLNDAEAPESNE